MPDNRFNLQPWIGTKKLQSTYEALILLNGYLETIDKQSPKHENLLKETRAMINGKENYKDIFSSWLSEIVPSAPLTKIFASYEKIEQFCLKLKVIKAPMFETMDVDIMNAVQKTVSRNKIFRIVNKKQLREIDAAMLCLSKFIMDGNFEKATDKLAPIV